MNLLHPPFHPRLHPPLHPPLHPRLHPRLHPPLHPRLHPLYTSFTPPFWIARSLAWDPLKAHAWDHRALFLQWFRDRPRAEHRHCPGLTSRPLNNWRARAGFQAGCLAPPTHEPSAWDQLKAFAWDPIQQLFPLNKNLSTDPGASGDFYATERLKLNSRTTKFLENVFF